MEKEDSDVWNGREKREARMNANAIKSQILKLVRIFSKKDMQTLLRKEFPHVPKQNDIGHFADTFEDLKKLFQERLRT